MSRDELSGMTRDITRRAVPGKSQKNLNGSEAVVAGEWGPGGSAVGLPREQRGV